MYAFEVQYLDGCKISQSNHKTLQSVIDEIKLNQDRFEVDKIKIVSYDKNEDLPKDGDYPDYNRIFHF